MSRLPGAIWIPMTPLVVSGVVMLFQQLLSTSRGESWSCYATRFLFIVAIMLFRMFVLYLGTNEIEHSIVGTKSECWYSPHYRSSCHGANFDFSDHTVLYLGQILPLPLMEVIHQVSLSAARKSTINVSWLWLLVAMPYLYWIALREEFKTAAYFHPPMEIIVGFVFSLSVQLPLAYLQCSPQWSTARQALFGHPAKVRTQ